MVFFNVPTTNRRFASLADILCELKGLREHSLLKKCAQLWCKSTVINKRHLIGRFLCEEHYMKMNNWLSSDHISLCLYSEIETLVLKKMPLLQSSPWRHAQEFAQTSTTDKSQNTSEPVLSDFRSLVGRTTPLYLKPLLLPAHGLSRCVIGRRVCLGMMNKVWLVTKVFFFKNPSSRRKRSQPLW